MIKHSSLYVTAEARERVEDGDRIWEANVTERLGRDLPAGIKVQIIWETLTEEEVEALRGLFRDVLQAGDFRLTASAEIESPAVEFTKEPESIVLTEE